MSYVKAGLGAVVGGAVAGVALRARRLSQQRGVPLTEVLADLPEVLREDLSSIGDAAQAAFGDAKRAAAAREAEIDRVLAQGRAASRRTEGNR